MLGNYDDPVRILWAGISEAIYLIDNMNFGNARKTLLESQEKEEELYKTKQLRERMEARSLKSKNEEYK